MNTKLLFLIGSVLGLALLVMLVPVSDYFQTSHGLMIPLTGFDQ